MRTLLIGVNSFAGKRVAEYFQGKHSFIGTYHEKRNCCLPRQLRLDITNPREVEAVIKSTQPEIIILPAAISSISELEEKTMAVNLGGVRNIVNSVNELDLNSKIVFFSSDSVFDGKRGMYSEEDKPMPINAYGRSKAEAEKVISTHPDHVILRLPLILGTAHGDDHYNFITSFIKADKRLNVFSDIYRTSVYAKEIPRAIETLIEKNYQGIINVSGDQYLNYVEMTQKIEKEFGISREYDIIPCPNPNIPKRLGLKTERLRSIIDFEMADYDCILRLVKEDMGR